MVASVAVLSDIHGVLPMLEAVLAEPDVQAAELIVVTGDHAAGPMPVPVLDRLTSLGPRCRLVRGNADRELVAVSRGERSEHPESRWAAAQLWNDQVRLLAELPHPLRLDVDGFGPVVFCHGTPRNVISGSGSGATVLGRGIPPLGQQRRRRAASVRPTRRPDAFLLKSTSMLSPVHAAANRAATASCSGSSPLHWMHLEQQRRTRAVEG